MCREGGSFPNLPGSAFRSSNPSFDGGDVDYTLLALESTIPANQPVPGLMADRCLQPVTREQFTSRSTNHQRNTSLPTFALSAPFTQTGFAPQIVLDSDYDVSPECVTPETVAPAPRQGPPVNPFYGPSWLSEPENQLSTIQSMDNVRYKRRNLSDPQVTFHYSPLKFASDIPDELCNFDFSMASSVAPSSPMSALSHGNEILGQTMQPVKRESLSPRSPSTILPREVSPLRFESLAPTCHEQDTSGLLDDRMQYARDLVRIEGPVKIDTSQAEQIQSQQLKLESTCSDSPNDALLKFREPDDFVLPRHYGHSDESSAPQGIGPMPVSDDARYLYQVQQHEQQERQESPNALAPNFHSAAASSTGGGIFSCTYYGCPRRFQTPALLLRHKREEHRQPHGAAGGRSDAGQASANPTVQCGPHICQQLNSSTGKPCNIEFSRPYDLTRHEDTIHNPNKRRITCSKCMDKVFSREDALSRHYRVCHPEVILPARRKSLGRS